MLARAFSVVTLSAVAVCLDHSHLSLSLGFNFDYFSLPFSWFVTLVFCFGLFLWFLPLAITVVPFNQSINHSFIRSFSLFLSLFSELVEICTKVDIGLYIGPCLVQIIANSVFSRIDSRVDRRLFCNRRSDVIVRLDHRSARFVGFHSCLGHLQDECSSGTTIGSVRTIRPNR